MRNFSYVILFSRIFTDATACLSLSVQLEYFIPVIPQMIHSADFSFTKGLEI